MSRSLALATALVLGLTLAEPSRADAQGARPVTAAPNATPGELLAAADAAIGGGDLQSARALFLRLTTEFPETREASEARRALAILAAKAAPAARAPALAPTPWSPEVAAAGDDDVINRDEPYSKRTSERLRLSIWEKVDFSVTAFLYGMSVGFSLALSQDVHSGSDILAPVAIGAIVYTLGSVAFLKTANPDRGDLPLALAITSYAPTTTLLLVGALAPNTKSTTVSATTTIVGILSIPVAVLAARNLQLDPGDTQLVRDAGFWGLALSTIGMLGFGGESSSYYGSSSYRAPSGRKVAVAGLCGLYGGLGLGLLGASASEVSLERVRVTTWGGYGGAVVGLLLGASMSSNAEPGLYRGAAIGAALGLGITFLSTGSLDGIPPAEPQRQAWLRRLAPMVVQVSDRDGRSHPGLGVGGLLF